MTLTGDVRHVYGVGDKNLWRMSFVPEISDYRASLRLIRYWRETGIFSL